MDAFVSVVNTLLSLALGAFSLFIQLVVSILSFFLVLFQALAQAFHIS
jgi:hypothetical protein